MIKSEYDVVAKGASIWGVIRNGNVSLLGQMMQTTLLQMSLINMDVCHFSILLRYLKIRGRWA